MDALLQDLRYALRSLAKSPGFTGVAVLTLALGIGANSAIFSVVDRVLLRPVPFAEPERLLVVGWRWGAGGEPTYGLPPAKYAFLRDRARSLDEVAVTDGRSYALSGEGEPEQLSGLTVSQNYFRTIGMGPARGRGFAPEEDVAGGARVAILSDAFWRRRFGADPSVLGRTLTLNGDAYQVIGIMPREYNFAGLDVLAPIQLTVDPRDQGHNYGVLARLAPGATAEQAAAELNSLLPRLDAAFPDQVTDERERFALQDVRENAAGGARRTVLVLFAAVGLLLLIACANVANLLLSRLATRRGELAIRAALGAGRGRLVRQLLTESVVLGLAGGVLGLVVAAWLLDTVVALAPAGIAGIESTGLDGRVFAFALTVSVLTGVAVGLAGSLRAGGAALMQTLREGGRARLDGRGSRRTRGALVAAEATLSMVLLAGAGLLIVSFFRLTGVDMGFRAEQLLTMELSLAPERYGSTERTWALEQGLLERALAVPGVTAAATSSSLPLERGLNTWVAVRGSGTEPVEGLIEMRAVSPSFFATLEVPLRRGRVLQDTDRSGAAKVAVVNEAFVRQFLAGAEPLGARVGGEAGSEVVGVVADVRDIGLDQDPRPTVYMARAQVGDGTTRMLNEWFPVAVMVRTSDPRPAAAALRDALREMDPAQPVLRTRTMSEVAAASVARQRFHMLLLGIFAALALALTAVGIYGVVSYNVRQRTREIGIRIALGAGRTSVLGMVVRQGMVTVAAGLAVGLLASLALTRFLADMLFGVSATDPATLAVVAGVLTLVAAAACYLPARRATRVDPAVTLRTE